MLDTKMPLDAKIKFVDIVSSIFSTILYTDNIDWLLSFLSTKFWRFSSYLFTVNWYRLFKRVVGRNIKVLLVRFLDLHPSELMSLLVATHLSHYVVHVDVRFRPFTIWHCFNGFLNATLRCQQGLFLHNTRIVLTKI